MRVLFVSAALLCSVIADDHVDLGLVHRIKTEAFENSKVMDTLSFLTDWYGPRLSGSPEFKEAAEWTMKRLSAYGLENVHLEKYPFGRSWSLQKYSVEMISPRYSLLAAFPLAWSRPTSGPVTAELVFTPMSPKRTGRLDIKAAEEDLRTFIAKYKGQLRGKIVMLSMPAKELVKPEEKAQYNRYTGDSLAKLGEAPTPHIRPKFDPNNLPEDQEELARLIFSLPISEMVQFFDRAQTLRDNLNRFLTEEGVAAIVQTDQRAHDALTFSEAGGNYKNQLAPPTFVITGEHYNRLARLVENKAPVKLQINLQANISAEAVDAYNIIGEIPGTTKRDEIVMVGAHFDSWHSGTGATDNGSGSAVMIEVMRILKALNLKPERTIRIALWSGEEQGLLGSRAYVKEHFADPKTMQTTQQHANLAGYFNLDNGSGKIRGVYLQSHDAMRPIFQQWLEPFRDLGVTALSIENTGGTDHLSFDEVGLPGFQFIQDPLDYMQVTHHSNMDVYDHVSEPDLMQASAVIATCVYQASTRPDKLPRKPLPPAQH